MKLNDRIIGALAVLGGLGIIAGTLGFREIPGQQFGSAFFPRIIGTALILAGLVQIRVAAAGPLAQVGDMLTGRAGLQVLAVLLAIFAWVALSPSLGFIATTAVLIALLALIAGGRPLAAILTGAAMAVLLYYVFARLLRVPLPYGVIESVLP